jgi:hypothetical protein
MMHLDMVIGGHFYDDTQDIVHYTEDVAHLMQSIGPCDDWTYPRAPFHTSWTLDDGHMSLDIAHIA